MATTGESVPARRFTTDVHVRWSDQDVNGHVNNAAVVTLIEDARLQWLNGEAVRHGAADFTRPKLVASLTVDYERPVSFGAPLRFAMHVSRLGTRSYTLAYAATQEDVLRFTASTVMVPLEDGGTGSRALTPGERSYLEQYRQDPGRGVSSDAAASGA